MNIAVDVEATVSSIIEELLGTELPDKDMPLSDIGLDSIDALDLFYRLEDRFNINMLVVNFGNKHDPAITQRQIEDKVKTLLKAVSV